MNFKSQKIKQMSEILIFHMVLHNFSLKSNSLMKQKIFINNKQLNQMIIDSNLCKIQLMKKCSSHNLVNNQLTKH